MTFPTRSAVTYALAGMISLAAAMGIGRFVYTPLLPGMMDELGLTASNAGFIAAANFAGYLFGAVAASGNWGQGRERVVALACLAASAALAAAMGLTQGVALFAAIRFLAGVASAFVMVFMTTIIFSRLASAGRPDLQGWHFAGVGLGITVSSVMTAILVLADAQWQAGWIWSGILSLVAFLAVLVLVDRGPALATRPAAEPPMPRSPAMTRVVIAYGLFGFGYIVTATFLVAIVRQGEAGRLFEAIVWLVTGLAAFLSLWLWKPVSARLGVPRSFALGCLVEAAGVVASVTLGLHAGPLIGGLLLGGTFVVITAYGLQIARDLSEGAPRRVLALMTAAFGVGQILGPLVAGVVADWTGSFVVPSLLAALALLVAAAVVRGVTPARG